jgi:hypothetical protein
MTAAPRPASPASRRDPGPVGFVFGMSFGAVVTVFFSWALSIAIEFAGMQFLWQERGVLHSRDLVIEDLGYIEAAPHSVIVEDTVAFSRWLIAQVAVPFEKLGVLGFYERAAARVDELAALQAASASEGGANGVASGVASAVAGRARGVASSLKRTAAHSNLTLATLGLIALYTAQDTALRLVIVVFALPAFVLACLLGAVDGLMRRDLRKWGGGRESSFVYHHAKATTFLALGGGFGLYLAWPTGGFNPAYMVLVFTALVAWSLSLTLSSFKKYL